MQHDAAGQADGDPEKGGPERIQRHPLHKTAVTVVECHQRAMHLLMAGLDSRRGTQGSPHSPFAARLVIERELHSVHHALHLLRQHLGRHAWQGQGQGAGRGRAWRQALCFSASLAKMSVPAEC